MASSALASRKVLTVPVDARTGMPQQSDEFGRTDNYTLLPGYRPMGAGGPPQTTKVSRGSQAIVDALNPVMPPRPTNSWPGNSDPVGPGPGLFSNVTGLASDPIYNPSDYHIPIQFAGTTTLGKDPTQLNSPPLAAYGETPAGSPGEQAIVHALIQGGNQMQGPPPPPDGWEPMQWEDAARSGPAPAGDPWANDRMGTQALDGFSATSPGLVTGAAPTSKVAALHQRLMASPQTFAANKAKADAAFAIDVAGGSTPHTQSNSMANIPAELRAKYVQKLNSGGITAARQFLANHTKK